jgi:hypothetical protein
MADSGKLAAGILLVGVIGLGAAAWFVRGAGGGAEAELGVAVDPRPAASSTNAAPAVGGVVPRSPAPSSAPDSGSLEARIADLQARLREEQQAQLDQSQRLGEEILALRASIAELEGEIQALEAGRMARLDARQGKQAERCDPEEPESRACKRQAALEEKLGSAEEDRGSLEAALSQARAREQALLEERSAALRAVDELAERQRSDPELVALIRQLAAEG